jgi:hypothetical protein
LVSMVIMNHKTKQLAQKQVFVTTRNRLHGPGGTVPQTPLVG